MWVSLLGGCGGRTLAGSEGDGGGDDVSDDDGGNELEVGDDGAEATGVDPRPSGPDAGHDRTAPVPETEFFICPPSPPPTESSCDPAAQVGQVCAYYGPASCQSWICSPSAGWQRGGQGC
jgi:hypothetical protein